MSLNCGVQHFPTSRIPATSKVFAGEKNNLKLIYLDLQFHRTWGVGFSKFMHVLSVGFDLAHADDPKEL